MGATAQWLDLYHPGYWCCFTSWAAAITAVCWAQALFCCISSRLWLIKCVHDSKKMLHSRVICAFSCVSWEDREIHFHATISNLFNHLLHSFILHIAVITVIAVNTWCIIKEIQYIRYNVTSTANDESLSYCSIYYLHSTFFASITPVFMVWIHIFVIMSQLDTRGTPIV